MNPESVADNADKGGGETSAKIDAPGNPWRGVELPRRYMDISEMVDTMGLDLLNYDSKVGDARTLFKTDKPSALATAEGNSTAKGDWVESDTDEQLMLFIPFRAALKVHTIQITSLPPKISEGDDNDDEIPMRPRTIRLYKNPSHNLDFDEAETISPTQTFTLGQHDWEEETGTAKLELRFVNFQSIVSLVMFIVDGERSGDKVRLDRVRIIGESGPIRETLAENLTMGSRKRKVDQRGFAVAKDTSKEALKPASPTQYTNLEPRPREEVLDEMGLRDDQFEWGGNEWDDDDDEDDEEKPVRLSGPMYLQGIMDDLEELPDPGDRRWGISPRGRLQDAWTYRVDNSFALGFFKQLNRSFIPQPPDSSQLCQRCSSIDVLSHDFELLLNLFELRKTAESCELCHMFHQVLKPSGGSDRRISRDGSRLKIDDHDRPILRICADPGTRDAPEDIQIGFPILPEVGSLVYFKLLREWLRVCDEEHQCLCGSYGRPESDCLLPTRVLDVGDDKNPNLLRLYCTNQGEQGRYITLSHCWGKIRNSEKEKFCTYMCNINKRCESIDWKNLPRTFQDAVAVARELGIRFLWIDSICIIQPHEGCSNECGELKDWDAESSKMERYYRSAYCTIAATSASDSTKGFLDFRSAGECVKVPNASDSPLYVCEMIDDFRRDVEEGLLNQRAWVLQERALSRRIIHFTTTQTYWECGRGIHCQTLTRMSNPSSFLSDHQFPESVSDNNIRPKITLLEGLFETYSKCALTKMTDRSIAISGLEKRLAGTFNTNWVYGIFQCYLQRSLLWQRSGNTKMTRISYSKGRKVPSWSWMAYEGGISYKNILFRTVAWSLAVRWHSTSTLQKGLHVELKALAREFSLNEEEGRVLIFDEYDRSDIRRLRCIVLGKDSIRSEAERKYYVLVVEPLSEEEHTYERVGVGSIKERHISFEGSGVEIRIV